MLFLTFDSQESRKQYGGSAFLEIQFCKRPFKTKRNRLVSVNKINHWKNDSLFVHVDDLENFYKEYSQILNDCIHNNLENGDLDLFGINYFQPSSVDKIIDRLNQDKPEDFETLIKWLYLSKEHNGFYILGI